MSPLSNFIVYLYPFLTLFAEENFDIKYFQEKSKQETIEQIVFKKFTPFKNSNFGVNSLPIWLKVTLSNDTNRTIKKIFEFQDNRLNRIKIYKNDVLNSVIGDMLPFNNRELKHPSSAFAMSVDANSEVVYYLRVSNKGSMNLRYVVYEEENYKKKISSENTFYAFYFGAALIMILYNLILFFFIKELVFFNYVVYHIFLVVVMLTLMVF